MTCWRKRGRTIPYWKEHLKKSKRHQPGELLYSDKPEGSTASYPALPLEQNGQRFYFSTLPKEEIFPFCYVADRQEDPQKGFQRVLDSRRAQDIAHYLDESIGSIPTNVVLSAQPAANLKWDASKKTLKYFRVPKAFLVLDGQHRLYGYGLTKKKHRVPVSIYEGLTQKEEVALFIDINTTQRGVPAALLLDIKQLAERETDVEAEMRQLFDYLNSKSDSPLCGLMSPAKSATGRIARPTFNRAASPVLGLPIMRKLQREKRFELFTNYLRALEQSLRDPKLLRVAAYFEAFCAILDDVLRSSRERFKDYKPSSLFEVLTPLKNIDLAEMTTKGKARLTKSTIVEVLKGCLFEQLHVDENMV
jgi:DGQHR domain-containing protein